ncbi:MAG: hypothetical protein IKW32_06590, partial [Bacteroidaceae bacterium]|nr:hypothetical protein [Bacteroidaceae bacterium]
MMVYLSSSFSWALDKIFMSIVRFACKDNTICKKRGCKNLILEIKILFLQQLMKIEKFKNIILC